MAQWRKGEEWRCPHGQLQLETAILVGDLAACHSLTLPTSLHPEKALEAGLRAHMTTKSHSQAACLQVQP